MTSYESVVQSIEPDLDMFQAFDGLVYPPREDTSLMLDAIDLQKNFLSGMRRWIEVGVGSGTVIVSLAHYFGQRQDSEFWGVDINEKALECANIHAETAGVTVNLRKSDLFAEISDKKFDVVIFNPPYVPSATDEVNIGDLTSAWNGGTNGTDTTFRFLNSLPQVLTENGICYLVVLKENKPKQLKRYIAEELGLKCTVVIKRKVGYEKLYIFKISGINPT
ncbi:hypothetical protein PCE1_005000 [Barthelona sp. PCE]